jgi:hypothetical protein
MTGFGQGGEYHPLHLGYNYYTSKGALRAYSTFLHSRHSHYHEASIHQSNSWDFSPCLGYEWHQPIGAIQILYGADLLLNFYFSRGYVGQDGGPMEENNRYMDWSTGIQPFLGLSVPLGNSFSLSMESRALFYIDFPVDQEYEKVGFGFFMMPLGLLSMNWHF